MLRKRYGPDPYRWGNYTLLRMSPAAYFVDNRSFWLPGFRLQDLGAASMSETLRSTAQALLEFPRQSQRIAETYLLFAGRSKTTTIAGIDGESYTPVFQAFLSSNISMSYTFLDVGPADGEGHQSPLFDFMKAHRDRIRGVALEGNETFCTKYRMNWPEVDLQCGHLTAGRLYDHAPFFLKSLRSVCSPHGEGGGAHCVDVWKVDIDSIDCTVLEVLLRRSELDLRPKAVILEVNPHFPPPYKFSVLGVQGPESDGDFWARNMMGLYGCSLSHQVDILRDFGYWLIGFDHKDALFVHKNFAHAFNATAPLDEYVAYSAALITIGSGLTPRTLRRWYSARPHVGLGLIQQHLVAAQQHLAQEVTFSLSI
ncbi:unnamed protein product [Symbiodinium natans]|uniref:Methyltransferase FkbM domain-containing protein n=1 Tax=Symbiodinium natans TaxID=878477 RepID=A0A812L8S0_9DINO|nr:unnamed protein product [Symbiodinium natans]